ncbi:MAG: hypothetical protein CMJ67_05030 [Planctomycetaceae bacterium]|nr:hypothetical protein [Planctomycetaceae bacterium]
MPARQASTMRAANQAASRYSGISHHIQAGSGIDIRLTMPRSMEITPTIIATTIEALRPMAAATSPPMNACPT